MKKVLVIGSGGREHAIVEALSRSPQVDKIYCAPGNAGIATLAECVAIGVEDVDALAKFAEDNAIDLTVVGPEAALAVGVADRFQEKGLRIFGPKKAAARIESSKEFAKEIMDKYGVPTAAYRVFDEFEPAWDYVKNRPLPAVIKYDGLAAGKGVVVALTYEEAEAALRDMLLDASFGKGRVVIEDFLDGPEFSFMCVVSGEKVYPLAIAQDHKRAFDGDKGPNTGGMGAYSPVPFISDEVRNEALECIIKPVAAGLVKEGVPFTGVLYGGLILTKEGPKVIEFNARFGDPETEVVLPRMKSDIYALFNAAVDGEDFAIEWNPEAVLGVVLASKGYPGSYKKGAEIKGLENVKSSVYHMGTAEKEGKILTAGGRVAMVVGKGATLAEARDNVLADIALIDCPELFHRSDIGYQAIESSDK
ncbi:MAG: phosphoribosylamine--glycine ligase [Bacteroides sp.]|nr:phosphoribosylamine--glycine ligase [Bacteroides sp.]